MKILLAITTLLFSVNSFALTGNELHERFSNENINIQNYAKYYVMGVMDAMGVYKTTEINLAARQKRKSNLDIFICPSNVIYDQGYDLVKNYLTNHPEIRNKEASVLIYWSLSEAWPCPAK